MYITLEADYAIRISRCLAFHGTRLDAQKISDMTKVSRRFCLKILRKLVSSGVVVSFKGAKGGYKLAAPPKEITLGRVIATVEGEYCFSRCVKDGFLCQYSCGEPCCINEIFSDISEKVSQMLENITLEDILKKSKIRENWYEKNMSPAEIAG